LGCGKEVGCSLTPPGTVHMNSNHRTPRTGLTSLIVECRGSETPI
jgi:hypothetical protein